MHYILSKELQEIDSAYNSIILCEEQDNTAAYEANQKEADKIREENELKKWTREDLLSYLKEMISKMELSDEMKMALDVIYQMITTQYQGNEEIINNGTVGKLKQLINFLKANEYQFKTFKKLSDSDRLPINTDPNADITK